MNNIEVYNENGIEIYDVNGIPMTTTESIAKKFSKDKRSINKALKNMSRYNDLISMGKIAQRENSGFKTLSVTYIDKDVMSKLIMGFTGKEAEDWQWQYIEAFNLMANKLQNETMIANEMMDYMKKFMPKGDWGELNEKTGLAKTEITRGYFRSSKHSLLSKVVGEKIRCQNKLNGLFDDDMKEKINELNPIIEKLQEAIKEESKDRKKLKKKK